MSEDVDVRRGVGHDYALAAALRWRWVADEMRPLSAADAPAFTIAFSEWAHAHRDTHALFIAFVGAEAVGMAWVALVPRVPSPGAIERRNADLQSVYIVPEARGKGIGGMLVRAAIEWAIGEGAERAEVHSGRRAAGFYESEGFSASPTLLDRDLR